MARITNYWKNQTRLRMRRRKFNRHVAKAIKLLGSQGKLAAKMGITRAHVSRLLFQERKITAESAVKMEKATRGQVRRKAVRPDLFV
jgi:DNA-binding transcriptional regulator YdaS (Cro superfamily)